MSFVTSNVLNSVESGIVSPSANVVSVYKTKMVSCPSARMFIVSPDVNISAEVSVGIVSGRIGKKNLSVTDKFFAKLIG